MSYFVGAYASSPNTSSWDPTLETHFYNELKNMPNIIGLEHPFTGSLHPHDDQWFADNLCPSWDILFTCIPGIMGAKSRNPQFGIASDDSEGRQEAIAFLHKAKEAVHKLNNHVGRSMVKGIQIQTSPSRNVASSSVGALVETLKTLSTWDWQGARLVIEHCDALVEGQIPAKGFMNLEEEIEAIKQVNRENNTNIGMTINWGRSVIETRRAQGAIEHIGLASEHDLLCGLMFSGASDQESEYGAWKDTHMPPKISSNGIGEKSSLMTEDEISKCLSSCKVSKLDFLGIKLGIRPNDTSLEDRVAYNRDALAILDRCLEK